MSLAGEEEKASRQRVIDYCNSFLPVKESILSL